MIAFLRRVSLACVRFCECSRAAEWQSGCGLERLWLVHARAPFLVYSTVRRSYFTFSVTEAVPWCMMAGLCMADFEVL